MILSTGLQAPQAANLDGVEAKRERAKATSPENGTAQGQPSSSAPAPGRRTNKPWRVEDIRFRASLLIQEGQGYQSQAGPRKGPGDEHLIVFQPLASLRVAHGERWTHDVVAAVDIVSSASADSLDAVSSASRENEAGEVVVTSSVAQDRKQSWHVTYGFHLEEHWRTGIAGIGFERKMAAENTVIAASFLGIYDTFDIVSFDGDNDGISDRGTINLNLAWTQILSPTTVASFAYGYTYQTGTLETTWNSVPKMFGPNQPEPPGDASVHAYRYPEVFPDQRHRHAFALRWAQHIPRSRTSAHLGYRFYFDDFGIFAHTAEFKIFQYIAREAYLKGSYRLHMQTPPDFFTTAAPAGHSARMQRTSDSDLASLIAHGFGGQIVVFLTAPGSPHGVQTIDASYVHYVRSNDLHVDVLSIGYGKRF